MNFFQKIPVFFFSLMYPMKVYGKENVPDAGAVLVCNHFRAIDCGFIVRICDKDIKFLAKKEIFKIFTKRKKVQLARRAFGTDKKRRR